MLFGRDRETIQRLRRELSEARQEMWMKDNAIKELRWWLAARLTTPVIDERWIHFRQEPKIAHRAPSGVFKIDSIDALIEGSKPNG
ncbi:hypothetical protein LCGC14_1364160 [marine sediment metagenome]|uniref:Uncharacterized protein n=1 Tax=marine sediment metagenome TaxID=412755 RepID=A0A0F9MMF1_9ZZZZ